MKTRTAALSELSDASSPSDDTDALMILLSGPELLPVSVLVVLILYCTLLFSAVIPSIRLLWAHSFYPHLTPLNGPYPAAVSIYVHTLRVFVFE